MPSGWAHAVRLGGYRMPLGCLSMGEGSGTGRSGWSRVRGILAVVLLVVLFVGATSAVAAAWLRTTIFDTDAFVATFASLPTNDAVAETIGRGAADAVIDQEQLAAEIAETLPDDLSILAVPVATAIDGLAADVATGIVGSEAFATVWETVLRAGHTVAIGFFERGGENGLTLRLEGIATMLIDQLAEAGIIIPVPDDASWTLIEPAEPSTAYQVLEAVWDLGWVLPLVTVLVAIGAVAVANDRRRIVGWVGAVVAASMALDIIGLRVARNTIADGIADPVTQEAFELTWNTVLSRLMTMAWITLIIGVLVAVGAWWLAGRGSGFREALDAFPGPRTAAFLERWGTTVQAGTAIVGFLLLLLSPNLRVGSALLLLLAMAAIIGAVAYGKRKSAQGTSTPTTSSTS